MDIINSNINAYNTTGVEQHSLIPVENKIEQSALQVLAETSCKTAPSAKLSIAERLEKNRKYAKEQQAQEEIRVFEFEISDISNSIEVFVPYKGMFNRSIEGHALEVNGRQLSMGFCQGRRAEMEDEEIAMLHSFKIKDNEYFFELFGVFDGHSGDQASKFVKMHIAQYLKEAFESLNPEALTEEGIFTAFKAAFKKLDNDYQGEDGTTATVSVILDGKIWVANTGDSRTILVKNGLATQASEDAKPKIARYKKTIEKLGGFVSWKNRVNGDLSVARAIGDKHIKGKTTGLCCISPNPKITSYALEDFKGGYLVLACDGLYEKATTNSVGLAIEDMVKNKDSVENMSKRLVYSAVKQGSEDNVSVIVVKL